MKLGLIIIHFALLAAPALASFEGVGSVTTTQFATETNQSYRLELDLRYRTEKTVDVRGMGFVEPGARGDRSLDLDPVVLRIPFFEQSHFWVGRTHPLAEQSSRAYPAYSEYPQTTSAVGTHWVQNRSDPLHPRVSGWIGLGTRLESKATGLFAVGTFSPLFLPNFGVRSEVSEVRAPEGARFSRLPPLFVRLNENTLVPLRYRVLVPDTKSVVLQNQGLLLLGHQNPLGVFSLMAWSSPAPAPELDVSGHLKLQNKDLFALATVVPSFQRRSCAAFQWSFPSGGLTPRFEVAHDFRSRDTAVSLDLAWRKNLKIGYLHTFVKPKSRGASGPSVSVEAPVYSQNLVWLEVHPPPFLEQVVSALRYERHLGQGQEDDWLEGSFRYFASPHFAVFASASVLSGQEKSYYGVWRGLDSVRMGAQVLW